MARIEIKKITKNYDGTKVLSGIDLTVENGKMFFLLGSSGCGKSTLLRIISGLIAPTSGSILADNVDLLSMQPEKRGTPMVFQNYALWPHMDVFDNVAFGLRSRHVSGQELKKEVSSLLELVRLPELAHRKIPSLSGGQQQRVALARALALEPRVLLLDEPLSNLDAKLRDSMRFELKRICRGRGLTAIYVTHDRREALSMADNIGVMNGGVLLEQGAPRKVYLEPETCFTASFLGDANILEVTGVDGHSVITRLGRLELAVPSVPSDVRHIMFRPESVVFAPSGVNNFTAVIKDTAYLGESSFRTLETEGVSFYANEFSPVERAQGDTVAFSIPPEKIALLKD